MSEEDSTENRLLSWYRTYIGPPKNETAVYLGFALFFGGIALSVIGVLVFLWSAMVPDDPVVVYTLREIAGATGSLGLPVLLVGITVLLPGNRRALVASVLGTLVCVGAVIFFVTVYPTNWNVTGAEDLSAQGVAIYTVGIVAVIASTGAALVGYRIERERAAIETATERDGSAEDGQSIDERVRDDIETEMASTQLSWGGIAKTRTKRLKIRSETLEEVDRTSFDTATATTKRSSGDDVDDAVSNLRKLQGGEEHTASGKGTDAQAAALKELRERRRAESENDHGGIFDRIRSVLFRR